ncbi:MAG: hypothetical protein ABIP75_16000 [Pyrinomonadaceae bacterium]
MSRLVYLGAAAILLATVGLCRGQTTTADGADQEFGPNVRAYFQYLKDEEEVVDDRISRREIRRDYYLRNMNRIKALREVALKLARESGNDYLPELEAVTADELHTIFEVPPVLAKAKMGQIIDNTYRFLGRVRTAEIFYVFARLDPYEQSDLIENERKVKSVDGVVGAGERVPSTPQKTGKSP